jgi:hypothetical protein
MSTLISVLKTSCQHLPTLAGAILPACQQKSPKNVSATHTNLRGGGLPNEMGCCALHATGRVYNKF